PMPYEMLRRMEALSDPERLAHATPPKMHARAAVLGAGLLARLLLLRCGYEDQTLSHDGNGKPFFQNIPVFVSLSHSGAFAAAALSKRPIGIDVQESTSVSPRVIQRVCNHGEQQRLMRSSNPKREFLVLWALKEAYFKAAGGTHSLSVMHDAEFFLPQDLFGRAYGPDGWCFSSFALTGNGVAALCEANESVPEKGHPTT
ncbi:MAG: 4'-phosphopantetheinyl transferase superfamily protein, partial [Oscillospiraceae bacterium]